MLGSKRHHVRARQSDHDSAAAQKSWFLPAYTVMWALFALGVAFAAIDHNLSLHEYWVELYGIFLGVYHFVIFRFGYDPGDREANTSEKDKNSLREQP